MISPFSSPGRFLQAFLLAFVCCVLVPLCPRPAHAVDVTDITLDVVTNGSLSGLADTRYYRLPAVTGSDPLIFLIRGNSDQSYYTVTVREGSLAGTVVGNTNKYGGDIAVEVPTPVAGDYYVTVANASSGDRTFTLLANRRPATTLILAQDSASQSLWGGGDVQYSKIDLTGSDSAIFMVRASIDQSWYDVRVHTGSVDGPVVGSRRHSGTDVSVEVLSPADGTYYLEVRLKHNSARTFIARVDRRPVSTLTLGRQVLSSSLWGAGDGRYFKVTVTGADPLLFLFSGTSDNSYYDIKVRFGSPTGDVVGTTYAYGTDYGIEVVTPPAGTYYVEVRNIYANARSFNFLADRRPVTTLALGQTVTNVRLMGRGDVRYYKVTATSTAPLLFLLAGANDQSYYAVKVRAGSLTGEEIVGTVRAYSNERSVELTAPSVGTYYIEVRAVYNGSRVFSLSARVESLVTPLATDGQWVVGQTLLGVGDVRFYKISVAGTDPLMVQVSASPDQWYYEVTLHQGSITGTSVGTKRAYGGGISVEVTAPEAGDYYLEVRNHANGMRQFWVQAARRPIETLVIGQESSTHQLWVVGDVAYFKVSSSGADPLLFMFWATRDNSEQEISVRYGSPTGDVVGVRRAYGGETSYEVLTPEAGDYYITVRNKYSSYTYFHMSVQQRPVNTFTLGGYVTNQWLYVMGDAQYYKITVPTNDPLELMFWGSNGAGEYEITLHKGSLTGPAVGAASSSSSEYALEVNPVVPGEYYLEVRQRYSGARYFTFTLESRPVVTLTPYAAETDQPLWVYYDVRYYRVRVPASNTENLFVQFWGYDWAQNYIVKMHRNFLHGGEVGTIQTNGTYLTIDLPSPEPGDYFIEVRNRYNGSRPFSIQADIALGYQADGLIKNMPDAEFQGDDIYNVSAAQTVPQTVLTGTPAVFVLQVQNDGNMPDGLKITGPAGSNGWTIKYIDEATSADITSSVTGTGKVVTSVPVGGVYNLLLEVTPGAAVTLGTSRVVAVKVASVTQPVRSDTVTAIVTAGYTPLGGTYTLDADFDRGTLTGVEHSTVHDQLQLSQTAFTLPFIWVPNSAENTVSKVDTRTGAELGRYYTCSSGVTGNPSRTTIDQQGNCWVANRNSGSIVKIGLLESGQYVDRNGNGIIDTSRDNNADGLITPDEMLPWGQDECVLVEVRLTVGSEATNVPGAYTGWYPNDYWTPGPRGIAVDASNNVWIGTFGSRRFYYLNGETGAILKNIDLSSINHTSYGAVIDQNGLLWSAGNDKYHVLWLNPADDSFGTVTLPHVAYGINTDKNNHIFVSSWTGGYSLSRINTLTKTVDWSKSGSYVGKGLDVTSDGDVWVANNQNGKVTRWSNDGVEKATINAGPGPSGISIGSDGKVWEVNYDDAYLRRIDPATNAVDFAVAVGGQHYAYSDMTGSVSRTTTTRLGTWTVIHNARVYDAPWGTVSWHGLAPEGTLIKVRVHSSNDRATWSAWEVATSGVALQATPPGRYLQVEVTLQQLSGEVSPVLYDLTVTPQPPVLRPDMQVKADADTVYLGVGIYNTETGQTKTIQVPTGTTAVYHLKLRNNGNLPDAFTLTTGSAPTGATIKYFDAVTGGNEITALITGASGWESNTLAAGAEVELRAEVVLAASVYGNIAAPVLVTATSKTLSSRTDTVKCNTVKTPLTAVTLVSNPVSPTAVGIPVVLTAEANGGGGVLYKFRVQSGTTWTELRAYGASNTCTWTPAAAGSYTLQVMAKEDTSTKDFDAMKVLGYTVKVPISAVALAMVPASPTAVGMPVKLTATVTGGGTIRYWFRVQRGTTWTDIQPYGASNTCTWTPQVAGNYTVQVLVKEAGSPNLYDKNTVKAYAVNAAIQSVNLTVSPVSPGMIGTEATLTGSTVGGGTVLYWFRVKKSTDTNWSDLQAYSTTKTCKWTPQLAGTYSLEVLVKETGSTKTYDFYKVISYIVNAP